MLQHMLRVVQVADATEVLHKDPRVASVRDIKLGITTLRRRARIVYLPAYVADYNFGMRFNQHGERIPEKFQAVVSGMGERNKAAPICYLLHSIAGRHFCRRAAVERSRQL